MPSIRVLSDRLNQHKVEQDGRKRISSQLRIGVGNALGQDLAVVEAFWWPAIESESADNMLPFIVEIEQMGDLSDETLENVFVAVWAVFNAEASVPVGTEFGVGVRLPGGNYYWEIGSKFQQ